ncbi:MAG: P-loop containing nucleoside triphosphate hydrolase protein [Linnemannia elongata]|nr:MAG: P-loop containing nucleoside triphosphate hydrolase protein [Linnemannia elongata]
MMAISYKSPSDSEYGEFQYLHHRRSGRNEDETHCVSSWGKDFRKAYARLGELRGIAPAHVAFVAMSATLPGPVLQEIKLSIRFHKNVTVYNLGNNRPNVRLEVRFLPYKNIFQAFDFLLDDIKKTIIYFDSRSDSQEVRNYLRNLRSRVANDEQDIIKSFHLLYSDEHKSTTLQHFREGRIKILLSTEAAGMGCDINDVVRVVQFKEPSTISCLVQRFGRAARDESMQGYAILLDYSTNSRTCSRC